MAPSLLPELAPYVWIWVDDPYTLGCFRSACWKSYGCKKLRERWIRCHFENSFNRRALIRHLLKHRLWELPLELEYITAILGITIASETHNVDAFNYFYTKSGNSPMGLTESLRHSFPYGTLTSIRNYIGAIPIGLLLVVNIFNLPRDQMFELIRLTGTHDRTIPGESIIGYIRSSKDISRDDVLRVIETHKPFNFSSLHIYYYPIFLNYGIYDLVSYKGLGIIDEATVLAYKGMCYESIRMSMLGTMIGLLNSHRFGDLTELIVYQKNLDTLYDAVEKETFLPTIQSVQFLVDHLRKNHKNSKYSGTRVENLLVEQVNMGNKIWAFNVRLCFVFKSSLAYPLNRVKALSYLQIPIHSNYEEISELAMEYNDRETIGYMMLISDHKARPKHEDTCLLIEKFGLKHLYSARHLAIASANNGSIKMMRYALNQCLSHEDKQYIKEKLKSPHYPDMVRLIHTLIP